MSDSDFATAGNDDKIPDVSTSEKKDLSDKERREKTRETYKRLLESRSAFKSVTLESPYGDIECSIDLTKLKRSDRWDCMKALPDGLFKGAEDVEDIDDMDEADVDVSSDVIPDGEGIDMLESVILKTMEAENLGDGQFKKLISEDLSDEVVMELGMNILDMSFDRGEVTGFRFH